MTEAPGLKPEGFLIIDKPSGATSHTVLRKVASSLGPKLKAGHAGTLDSFATGILVCLFGRYTRLADYFMAAGKSYLATLQFGSETDTLDPTGTVCRTAALPTLAALEAVLPNFRGSIRQFPPVYSAVHVDGKRAYQRVLDGETPAMEERSIQIQGLRLLSFDGQQAVMEIDCSKGTYIRSLARDIGQAAGSCAYLAALRRTASGPFSLADSITPEHVSQNGLRPLSAALAVALDLSVIKLDSDQAAAFRNGRPLLFLPTFQALAAGGKAGVAVFDMDDVFLGIVSGQAGAWSYALVLAAQL